MNLHNSSSNEISFPVNVDVFITKSQDGNTLFLISRIETVRKAEVSDHSTDITK